MGAGTVGGPGSVGVGGGLAGPGGAGLNWNRFDAGYQSRYPGGYNTFAYGGRSYYWYASLPAGATMVAGATSPYYTSNGVYYMPYVYNGQVVYVAVPPP